jgi:hypothetical protein
LFRRGRGRGGLRRLFRCGRGRGRLSSGGERHEVSQEEREQRC